MLWYSAGLKVILRLCQICGARRKVDINGWIKKMGKKKINCSLEICGCHCEMHEIRSGVGILPDIR